MRLPDVYYALRRHADYSPSGPTGAKTNGSGPLTRMPTTGSPPAQPASAGTASQPGWEQVRLMEYEVGLKLYEHVKKGSKPVLPPEEELLKPEQPDGSFVPYVLVDHVNYRDSAPWPGGATDGGGDSLQRRNSGAYGNDPANWTAAAATPGADFAAAFFHSSREAGWNSGWAGGMAVPVATAGGPASGASLHDS